MVEVGQVVEVRVDKWDGTYNRRAMFEVVAIDEAGLWLWCEAGAAIERPTHRHIQPCGVLRLIPPAGMWHISWLVDLDPVVYVDITTSIEITSVDGIVSIRTVDLDLDVIRLRDGTVTLLDEDEFEEHTRSMNYPAETVEDATAAAAWVVEQLTAGTPPFAPTPPADRLPRHARPGAQTFPDWVRAPNIAGDPDTYELENEAIARDGRLDDTLAAIAPWDGRTVLDIGCGTGFWLPRYAERAAHVIGVEPDPDLMRSAIRRIERGGVGGATIDVVRGSAERLPLGDGSVDIAHARFAYFFGPGADSGLAEIARVLRPDGVLLVIDNSWRGGDFAELLRAATTGNAAIDPDATDRWWTQQGAVRHEVEAGWQARSVDELDRILRIEFPAAVVDGFMTTHRRPRRDSAQLSYRYAVYEWRPSR